VACCQDITQESVLVLDSQTLIAAEAQRVEWARRKWHSTSRRAVELVYELHAKKRGTVDALNRARCEENDPHRAESFLNSCDPMNKDVPFTLPNSFSSWCEQIRRADQAGQQEDIHTMPFTCVVSLSPSWVLSSDCGFVVELDEDAFPAGFLSP
jgi:hypothetical protein